MTASRERELHEFCRRVLGSDGHGADAADDALSHAGGDDVELFAAAVRACRSRAELASAEPQAAADAPASLAAAVAHELAQATARLPERQREALALADLVHLSHGEIARAMNIESSAVAPLLGRARLALRAERRGGVIEQERSCPEHDRAIRVLALRQDSEPLSTEDEGWILEHLGGCGHCARAHAAMLEASICYRAWRVGP